MAVVFCPLRPVGAAAESPHPVPPSRFIILTEAVKIRIAYGETTLPVGMRLAVVSNDATSVRVSYMGEIQSIPSSAARFDTSANGPAGSSPAPSPRVGQAKPPEQTAPSGSQISLLPGYDSRMQGGDVIMRELQLLLSPYCTEAIDLSGAGEKIYHEVTYLMDSEQAAAALGLAHATSSRALVATPGFPRNSTYYTGYDGAFEGRFNRLYLVTDAASKTVAVQLVDEHPNTAAGSPGSGRVWSTYNFLNARMRASDAVRVAATSKREGNSILLETRMSQLVRQRKGRGSVNRYEEKEHTKLFLAIPFARIIMHCAQAGLSKA